MGKIGGQATGADGPGHLEAVHARHLDIQQHDGGHFRLQHFQGFHAIPSGGHPEAFPRQESAGDLAHGEGVIHHHHQGQGFGGGFLLLHAQAGGALGELEGIEDEGHAAVAQHRGAADAGDAGQLRADVLHHRLEVAFHGVHPHRETLFPRLQQQDGTETPLSGLGLATHQFGQGAQGIDLAGELQLARLVQGVDLIGARFPDQGHQVGGQGIGLPPGAGENHLGKRQGQGQADGEAAALAGLGVQAHPATDTGDLVLHHVQADPPAGDLGDRRGGGEARAEQEMFQLLG
jgi:hypothetical protein